MNIFWRLLKIHAYYHSALIITPVVSFKVNSLCGMKHSRIFQTFTDPDFKACHWGSLSGKVAGTCGDQCGGSLFCRYVGTPDWWNIHLSLFHLMRQKRWPWVKLSISTFKENLRKCLIDHSIIKNFTNNTKNISVRPLSFNSGIRDPSSDRSRGGYTLDRLPWFLRANTERQSHLHLWTI